MGEVTRDVLATVRRLGGGSVEIDARPQEVPWTVPLDEDDEHAHYDTLQAGEYFAAAIQAALILAAFRAPYRGRSTPVNAWWGSFDLAVSLFSGRPAKPPSDEFIMRNAMDSQEVAVGWWPGDARHGQAAFYAYAYPAPEGFDRAVLSPGGAHWDAAVGEFILDWDDVRSAPIPGPPGWSSPARHSGTRARCAGGIWLWPRPPKARPRRSTERSAIGVILGSAAAGLVTTNSQPGSSRP